MNPEGELGLPLRAVPGVADPLRWRFIPATVAPAAMNMAIDEALLFSYLNHLSPQTVRLYGWSRPSVTFGYRLDWTAVDAGQCGEENVVRRPTGGGVVYHRECVTIGIVGETSSLSGWVSREGLPPVAINRAGTLYRAIGTAVRSALVPLGIGGSLVPESASWSAQLDCFSNPCPYDIMSGDRKIYGAAQLRVGRAFLYQGNLVSEEGFDVVGFGNLLCESIGRTLGWALAEGALSAAESKEAARIFRTKYRDGDWNRFGRSLPGRRMRPVARDVR